MKQSSILFVASSATQALLQAKSQAGIVFAAGFEGLFDEGGWDSLVVEISRWEDQPVNQFVEAGIPVFGVSSQPLTAKEVFEFRAKGAKKLYGLRNATEIALFYTEIAVEARRFHQGRDIPTQLLSAKSNGAISLIGESPLIIHLADRLFSVAKTDLSVLILGETGAGKEVVAQMLHSLSERKGKVVSVNCSALPADLAESLLFGHEKGAFSGATERKAGFFEQAEGGTLFLDEVFELPELLQAKLLRVLQEGAVTPLGGKEKKFNVRIIAATNRRPEQMLRDGGLRADFYYRFKSTIEVPNLRSRAKDIPMLVDHFLAETGKDLRIGDDVMRVLQAYAWPGNVRELKALLENLASGLKSGDALLVDDLPTAMKVKKERKVSVSPVVSIQVEMNGDGLEDAIRLLVRSTVDACGGNRAQAAAALGIHRNTMAKYLGATA